MLTRLSLLGCTGSIGTATLDIVRRNPERFAVHSLVAGTNTRLLAEQIQEFRPSLAVVADAAVQDELCKALQQTGMPQFQWPQLACGAEGRLQAATASEVDCVVSAIVGVAGLEATHAAARLGKRIALANKEAMVAAGRLMVEAAREGATELLPVDSEHNGVHQCLRAGRRDEVRRLILTASGGPFRTASPAQLALVTPQQALQHPTWKMGPRITVDSATLMNKGLEVVEACWLFGFPVDQVDVVVHPQSSVHAMVEYLDGSVILQVSATDMRMPIQYALTYPERQTAPVPRLDWTQMRTWEFQPPDTGRFPLLRIAYEAQRAGGCATCVMNAADEIAVEEFLGERLAFPDIAAIVEETLSRVPQQEPSSIQEVLAVDQEARRVARLCAQERAKPRMLSVP